MRKYPPPSLHTHLLVLSKEFQPFSPMFKCLHTHHNVSFQQTRRFWVSVQLRARWAQLKRRLAVREEHVGSAGGWRRSIYQRWRNRALISAGSPTGRRRGWQTCLDLLCFHRRRPLLPSAGNCCVLPPCLKRRVCFAVLLCNQRCSPPHLHHPTPPQLSVDSHTSVSHTHAHTHTSRKHAHWAISLGSLTRGCLLLRDEFSWPINSFLPGRA